MASFSALLALCEGNSPATGEFPSQRPVTRSFDIFFDLRLNKQLNKQSWGWWFGTPSRSLWRHCNVQPKSHRWWHQIRNTYICKQGTVITKAAEVQYNVFTKWNIQVCVGLSTCADLKLRTHYLHHADQLITKHEGNEIAACCILRCDSTKPLTDHEEIVDLSGYKIRRNTLLVDYVQ